MGKLIRDIMKIGVPVCNRDARLPEVARIMALENADAIVVMDEFGACGVVSQTDLVRAYSRNYELLTAQDVMTEKILEVAPEAPITVAANVMNEDKVHQVFLMHSHPGTSRPSAVVTMRAIVREMGGLEPEKTQTAKTPSKKES